MKVDILNVTCQWHTEDFVGSVSTRMKTRISYSSLLLFEIGTHQNELESGEEMGNGKEMVVNI